LYVPQSDRLEVIVRALYILPIHGLRKPLETLGSEFGQQSRYVPKVVSGRAVRNAGLARTGAQREPLHAVLSDDLLASPQ
jgi:hypothetical protein